MDFAQLLGGVIVALLIIEVARRLSMPDLSERIEEFVLVIENRF